MKIAIIGRSALGTLLAANLTRAKNEVFVFDDSLKSAKEIGDSEAIFICAKSYDTENILKSIKGLVKENTFVISLQNGLGNLQLMSEYIDSDRIIGGVTAQEAILEDGRIKHINKGETVIGQDSGKILGGIRDISSLLNKANFPAKISKDINSVIWSKLIIDVGISAISAITKLRNGMLVKNERTREMVRRAVSEAAKVAKRKRVKLAYDDPIQKVESVCRATADNLSSMLQDFLNREPTEIDFINGAIVRQAKSLNIEAPMNEMLTELVKTIESNYKNSL